MARSKFGQVLQALVEEARENGKNNGDILLQDQIDYLEERVEDTESLYQSSLAEIDALETDLLKAWFENDRLRTRTYDLQDDIVKLRQQIDTLRLDLKIARERDPIGDAVADIKTVIKQDQKEYDALLVKSKKTKKGK